MRYKPTLKEFLTLDRMNEWPWYLQLIVGIPMLIFGLILMFGVYGIPQ